MAAPSILECNAPTRWQARLNEVERADTQRLKEIACQHFSRAIDENIADMRRSIDNLVREAESGSTHRQQMREAAKTVFRVCIFMNRLSPGVAAVTKLAARDLPTNLSTLHDDMWQTLADMEALRTSFSAGGRPSANKCIDLAQRANALCDALVAKIVKFYLVAQRRYELPPLNDREAR